MPGTTRRATRDEITAHVEDAFVVGGASRTDLLRSAMNTWAPRHVVDTLLELPDGYYRDIDTMWNRLPEPPRV